MLHNFSFNQVSIHLQLTKDEVVLVTSKAERVDSGQYRLTLRNPSGVGEGTLNVTVLGRYT